MKITKSQLKKIIREEIEQTLEMQEGGPHGADLQKLEAQADTIVGTVRKEIEKGDMAKAPLLMQLVIDKLQTGGGPGAEQIAASPTGADTQT